ncbi:MAG: hypothetical protein A3I24_00175 [Candidatus Harrisonbacteria bacterium RIFCSPLOWO2_02_FULL_41_13b]|uniref:Uncharacterized protein n=1 Tax=Candidatus Harrisonbacteria bacterium RIFCSPLOWO2_02_FULL_41_13b TaxID=1798409 RepID=A0A1G1ZUS4_9BACT|nr:MAG: hypothetical protein A3J53_00875 [Candidatus Harrisonbacteria bacterium RIFCSPHIGHO2_02_FULL_40_20]OGY67500.1 MAG: hypothetical protein A3I24_00175 [Candidatus Harrisonbacteria bacterium RIFCSPLOWO2_02_FULL_41_13b]
MFFKKKLFTFKLQFRILSFEFISDYTLRIARRICAASLALGNFYKQKYWFSSKLNATADGQLLIYYDV